MTPIERQYLLCIFITKPEPEHGKIKDVIHDISMGNICTIELHKNCVAIAFSTKFTATQIEKKLTGHVLNADNRFIVEIGNDWCGYGLNSGVYSWLRRILGDPK